MPPSSCRARNTRLPSGTANTRLPPGLLSNVDTSIAPEIGPVPELRVPSATSTTSVPASAYPRGPVGCAAKPSISSRHAIVAVHVMTSAWIVEGAAAINGITRDQNRCDAFKRGPSAHLLPAEPTPVSDAARRLLAPRLARRGCQVDARGRCNSRRNGALSSGSRERVLQVQHASDARRRVLQSARTDCREIGCASRRELRAPLELPRH